MNHMKSLLIYTISHFSIDLACFYFLAGTFSHSIGYSRLAIGFLLYNTVAFGTQTFIGYAADRASFEHWKIAISGCVMTAIGLRLSFVPWPALLVCAAGNALFHVGGGINSLVYSDGRMARSGIFVSSGAVGVVLGVLAAGANIPPFLLIAILLLCGALVYLFCRKEKDCRISAHPSTDCYLSSITGNIRAVIFLCLISIVIRSFTGMNLSISWKTSTFLTVLPGLCAFGGKFAGGLLADRFGARTVGTMSLIISIPLLCCFSSNVLLCSAGLFMFNITMPLTLWGVASRLPNQPGFAFGLTTLALLAGSVPIFFHRLDGKYSIFILAVLMTISAFCVFLSLGPYKKLDDRRNSEFLKG
ncbi:hypothetical protein CLHUN_00120 [Ruminiclostridium hungatei]|uniref:Fosmidomycin resistance protein n=1 Tax=Ruminiclostridium hungatei TaxID=48256 RepID=A0A1V4SRW7_RUMHU|nr:hypothetical protein [Ruminiclostridium hungatei]OPX46196.1 hypothetical protein CLHUN_00120 [Ruminiclostridium hungatei]